MDKLSWYYCQKILPVVYDDSLSYYEFLCKIAEKLNEVIDNYGIFDGTLIRFQEQIDELKKEFEEFKEHGFDDYYAEQVKEWIANNLTYIFDNVIRQVYFGLTLEGYFVAYIPKGWDEIIFDTGMQFGVDTYGRLILRWDTDSPSTVDQTREVR